VRQHGGRRRVGAELNVGGGLRQEDVRVNVVRASGNELKLKRSYFKVEIEFRKYSTK